MFERGGKCVRPVQRRRDVEQKLRNVRYHLAVRRLCHESLMRIQSQIFCLR